MAWLIQPYSYLRDLRLEHWPAGLGEGGPGGASLGLKKGTLQFLLTAELFVLTSGNRNPCDLIIWFSRNVNEIPGHLSCFMCKWKSKKYLRGVSFFRSLPSSFWEGWVRGKQVEFVWHGEKHVRYVLLTSSFRAFLVAYRKMIDSESRRTSSHRDKR